MADIIGLIPYRYENNVVAGESQRSPGLNHIDIEAPGKARSSANYTIWFTIAWGKVFSITQIVTVWLPFCDKSSSNKLRPMA